VAVVRDLREVARELKAHALAHREFFLIGGSVQALEEEADRHPQHTRNFVQASGRNAIDAALVLVRLLISHPDQLRHLLLAEAQHNPTFTDAIADIAIRVRPPGNGFSHVVVEWHHVVHSRKRSGAAGGSLPFSTL